MQSRYGTLICIFQNETHLGTVPDLIRTLDSLHQSSTINCMLTTANFMCQKRDGLFPQILGNTEYAQLWPLSRAYAYFL